MNSSITNRILQLIFLITRLYLKLLFWHGPHKLKCDCGSRKRGRSDV